MLKTILIICVVVFYLVSCAKTSEKEVYKNRTNTESEPLIEYSDDGKKYVIGDSAIKTEPTLEGILNAILVQDRDKTREYLQEIPRPIPQSTASILYNYASQDIPLFEVLIDEKINPNCLIGDEGYSVLQWVCRNDLYAYVPGLINLGADVNFLKVDSVYSSLALAISEKTPVDFVDLFMSAGLDIHYKGYRDLGYFVFMLFNKRADMALRYVQYDAVFETIKNDDGLGYWFVYYWSKDTEKVYDYLWEHGVKIDTNLPLLHLAIEKQEYDAFVWLYEHGFDISKEQYAERYDITGTPLDYVLFNISVLKNFSGRDYAYTEDSDEVQTLRKIESFIRENL